MARSTADSTNATDAGATGKRPRKGATATTTRTSTRTPAARKPVDPEFAEIRHGLQERLAELRAEHTKVIADIQDLQRERVNDGAGDDQADTGTKTFEREQELALASGIAERISQVEQALSRVDAGTYGSCERCGNPIPKARLEAFPSVTLCVTCKQLEERR